MPIMAMLAENGSVLPPERRDRRFVERAGARACSPPRDIAEPSMYVRYVRCLCSVMRGQRHKGEEECGETCNNVVRHVRRSRFAVRCLVLMSTCV